MKLVTCMLALSVALLGCGSSQATQIRATAFNCATVDIGRTIPDIGMTVFQDVMAIIQAGASGWATQLETIGAKYGEDALACAAKAAYDALSAHPSGAQGAPDNAALRAQTYIEAKAFKFQ